MLCLAGICSDLHNILRIPGCETFQLSVNRPNLYYQVSLNECDSSQASGSTRMQKLHLALPCSTICLWLWRPVQDTCSCGQHMTCSEDVHQQVRWKASAAQDVVDDMTAWIATHYPGNESGIVYCMTRKDAESLSGQLNAAGLSSSFYHADMDPVARQRVHHQWSKRKAR